MRISDWSSDVCSSDLIVAVAVVAALQGGEVRADPSSGREAIACRKFEAPDLRLLTLNHASPADHLDPRAQIRLGPEVAGRQVEPVAAVSDTGFDVVGDHRLEVHQLIRSEEHTSELQSLMRIS